ncbi:hypothetical protein [Pedobacter sp.]|uniref:hypothetical protein n=1 Tax=Pedobacter sp. TaxID=1411316 RepID=UPI0031D84CC2
MKSFKILIFVTAIAMVSVTTSKSFGSPGELTKPVSTEVTLKSDQLNFNLVTPEVSNPLISAEMINKINENPVSAWPVKVSKEAQEALIAELKVNPTDFEKEVLCSPHLGDAMDSLMIKKGYEGKLRKPGLSNNPNQVKAHRRLRKNIS